MTDTASTTANPKVPDYLFMREAVSNATIERESCSLSF